MICPYCGKRIPDEAIFCSSCGRRISGEDNLQKKYDLSETHEESRESRRTLPIVAVLALVAAVALVAFFAFAKPRNGGEANIDITTIEETSTGESDQGEEPSNISAENGFPQKMYVSSEDGLYLREGAGTDKEEIRVMTYGEEIEVDKIENGWAHATVDDVSGWCSTEYLTDKKEDIKIEEKKASGTDANKLVQPANVAEQGFHGTIKEPDGVNMRYGPGTDYGVIETLPQGTPLVERGWDADWIYVEHDGKFGWISSEYFYTGAYGKEKPVIYLYPTRRTEVSVKVKLRDGKFTHTDPLSPGGEWLVTAEPDGTLTDKASGRTYDYIFWESDGETKYDWSEGYVVEGRNARGFLTDILPEMGLNKKETAEFIEYWLQRLEKNEYNLVTFQTKCYTDAVDMSISPRPDSVLRVFMAFKKLSGPASVKNPKIEPFERNGFTVVEWGGEEVR